MNKHYNDHITLLQHVLKQVFIGFYSMIHTFMNLNASNVKIRIDNVETCLFLFCPYIDCYLDVFGAMIRAGVFYNSNTSCNESWTIMTVCTNICIHQNVNRIRKNQIV